MSRIFLFLVCACVMCAAATANAQTSAIKITPVPVSLQVQNGEYTITQQTTIGVPDKQPELAKIAAYLSEKLSPASGFSLKTTTTSGAGIVLSLKSGTDKGALGDEGYTLQSTSSGVTIEAFSAAGLFYGVQSLLQLLPPQIESKRVESTTWRIPAVSITDYPRFKWRGLMLDVSRHFFTKEEVKAYIDQMARFKFNRLHWHLTDDQGWRIEIKSLPKLTSVGAWRVPRTGLFNTMTPPKPGEKPTYGGFYTQEDIKEVIQYAKSRYIEIMPEVDVPGHSMAAIASYPELSITNDTTIRVNPGSSFATWGNGTFVMHTDNSLDPTDEKTYQFLTKVFGEIASLFPFEYIHVGGDECYKGFWERDPGAQAFMKKNKIASGTELQAYFMKRVAKIVEGQKKKMIGWDEILEGGIAPNAAVMAWRGVKGGVEATHLKHPVVMSPAIDWYLDMMQGDVSTEVPVYGTSRLDNVYKFNLLPEGIDASYVIGGQANIWTEQIASVAQLQYMTYPRALAVSETLWSPEKNKDWKNFVTRVEDQFVRFDAAGVNYSRSVYDPSISITKSGEVYAIEMKTELDDLDIYYTLDNAIPNQYHPKYTGGKIMIPVDVYRFRAIGYRKGKQVGTPILIRREDFEKRSK
ncbi:family 20 glycosylhydrolase [Chryseolinea sp. T2]|uniref:beta-N-acetylhexosaminidase n=1 Tax=Chryseolinea sp. T2 TaxID=3129255 RepID=UPI00307844DE